MSALRQAADAIRDEEYPPRVGKALAALLVNESSLIESATARPELYLPLNGTRTELLSAVARAILGETP